MKTGVESLGNLEGASEAIPAVYGALQLEAESAF